MPAREAAAIEAVESRGGASSPMARSRRSPRTRRKPGDPRATIPLVAAESRFSLERVRELQLGHGRRTWESEWVEALAEGAGSTQAAHQDSLHQHPWSRMARTRKEGSPEQRALRSWIRFVGGSTPCSSGF